MVKVLEVNVDDLYSGGVFSLIKNIIINKNEKLDISIAAIEKFEKDENLDVSQDMDAMYIMLDMIKVN